MPEKLPKGWVRTTFGEVAIGRDVVDYVELLRLVGIQGRRLMPSNC
ncbi:MAG: hypothetical protein ABSH06_28350 [Thermodesulfobacteriota bacterium]